MEKILNRKVRVLLLCLVGMLMAVKGVAQAIIVKGSVKDKTGEAIIGANVLVKGTTNGTITDFNGNFALDAKKAIFWLFHISVFVTRNCQRHLI